jgi:uncharacterized protein (DUF736 family)
MDYDNTDTGALFKNDKQGNENRPDYTGEIYDADGTKRRIAAWLRESKSGTKYMSLKVTDFQEQQNTAPQQSTFNPSEADLDVPF